MPKTSITLANGKVVQLNAYLIKKHGISDETVSLILHSHYYKSQLYEEMEELDYPPDLKEFAKKIEELEFYMQELWGFPKNSAYHRFWEVPHCYCRSQDNWDAYGSGVRYYSSSCPVHG